MPVRKVAGPTDEPITLAEARAHLRVETTDEDAMISTLITVAREQAEHRMLRSITLCDYLLTLDDFPDAIELPTPRVVTVLGIEYTDEDGVDQTLDPLSYVLDEASEIENWIVPAQGYAWPTTPSDTINNVRITYRAGWTSPSQVPASVKQWILLAVGTLYSQREGHARDAVEIPRTFFDALLDPYRTEYV